MCAWGAPKGALYTSKEGGWRALQGKWQLTLAFSPGACPAERRAGKLEISPSTRTCVPGTSACLSLLISMAVLILRNEEYEGMQRSNDLSKILEESAAGRDLYSFPIAAATSYHKRSGLKQPRFIIWQFGRP